MTWPTPWRRRGRPTRRSPSSRTWRGCGRRMDGTSTCLGDGAESRGRTEEAKAVLDAAIAAVRRRIRRQARLTL